MDNIRMFDTSQNHREPAHTIMTITGHKISLSKAALAALPKDIVFIQFFLVCAAILFLDGGGEYIAPMKREMDFGLLMASVLFVVFTIWLWIYAFFKTSSFLIELGHIKSVFTPFLTVSIGFLIFFATGAVAHLFIEDLEPLPIWTTERVRDVVVLLILDFIFVRFVCPELPVVARMRAGPAASQEFVWPDISARSAFRTGQSDQQLVSRQDWQNRPTPNKVANSAKAISSTIDLAGNLIDTDALRLIRSEDHHLRCYFKRGELSFRGTMRSLVETADVSHGIQINRSTWVPFKAVKSIKRRDNRTVLLLADGSYETIANSRRIAVQSALETYGYHPAN